MKKHFLLLVLLSQMVIISTAYSQNIAINSLGSLPDTSAMLDVSSTNKGFLAPRMTTVQQNAIPLPALGLLVFNTTDNVFKVNTGTPLVPVWTALALSGTSGITSLNALTGGTQTFAVGTANSDFGITSSGTIHTFNLPTASATKRGALSAADWITFNGKQDLLVSGTTIKTINTVSVVGSGNINVEPVIAAPNTIKKYLNGYKQFVTLSTDSIAEGATNLYYTVARARTAISLTTLGTSGAATYNNSTGVLNVPNYAVTNGTVTSVGLTSSDITVGGSSPITTSGAYTLALPTVNSNTGTFTNATITVNAKGLVTAASTGSSGSGWSLTGNSGTTPPTNYIGTSDAQPFVFKVNGVQAGYLGLTGSSYATTFGVSATATYRSTAIGWGATANTNNEAVALGYTANATGQQTVALGSGAVAVSNEAIAIGYSANAEGYRSIAIGSAADATPGYNETIALGYNANANSTKGIAIGSGASTSSNNNAMAVGVGAIASGYLATAIGNSTSATGQNSTAIGNSASESNANYIAIGNGSVTAIRGNVNFTTYSDGRFKKNIQADVPGLDFILQLRPVTYNWDIHKFNAHKNGDEFKLIPAKYATQNSEEEAAIVKKESITYTGFIAQEVEKAAQACKYNFSGVLKPQNEKDAYSLSYAEFVVPLVKATQELNHQNEALNKRLNDQQKIIDQLVEEVNLLKTKR
ncbi:MAG: hypothetical protein JWP81_1456 [Ferruginibacter sp.]|nr:hypothetical protein [Ferruginibacter sp.]